MNKDRNVIVTISNRTIARVIAWAIAAFVAVQFVDKVSHALTLIFISFFLALALNPVVSAISKRLKSNSRAKATAFAYLLVLSVVVLFFVSVVPPLISQTRDFVRDVPQTVSDFQSQNSSLSRLVARYDLNDRLSQAASDFSSQFGNVGSKLLDVGKRVGSTVISIIVVIVMTFMMLVEGPKWLQMLWANAPLKRREHNKKLANKMYGMVTGFVLAQIILALLSGTFALIALLIASTLLDVSINAAALAGIVALLALIPMIGNLISTAVVVLICALASVNLAIVMLIYFIVYQQIENVTLQPYIQSRKNELTPLLVFVAALVGVNLGGILGAFVAIPVAGCIKILLEDQLEKRRGRQTPTQKLAT